MPAHSWKPRANPSWKQLDDDSWKVSDSMEWLKLNSNLIPEMESTRFSTSIPGPGAGIHWAKLPGSIFHIYSGGKQSDCPSLPSKRTTEQRGSGRSLTLSPSLNRTIVWLKSRDC